MFAAASVRGYLIGEKNVTGDLGILSHSFLAYSSLLKKTLTSLSMSRKASINNP